MRRAHPLTMTNSSSLNGSEIVTGDTKVVEKGRGDKLYINTAGIGILRRLFLLRSRRRSNGLLLPCVILENDFARFLVSD